LIYHQLNSTQLNSKVIVNSIITIIKQETNDSDLFLFFCSVATVALVSVMTLR